MNKTGFQFQVIGEAQRSMLRASWPHTLKMLQGGKSLDLAREWRSRRPDGVLVLRYVTADDEPLSQLPRLTDAALREFQGFQSVGGRVILEVPVNERFHTDPADFAALAEASVASAATIKTAGFTPGVLVTSEGNPPGPDHGIAFFEQPRVLECLLTFRAMGAVWCPHGYSHPPDPSDDEFHSTRPARILARLPELVRLNYLYGEDGCDGGTAQPNQKKGRGWTDYFDSPAAYAAWYRAKSHALAADPLCVGSAIFLSGADPGSRPPWDSFDIRDEVDLRGVFTEDVPGPPITWLQPVKEVPTVPDIALPAPSRVNLAAPENYQKGPRATTRGVVIHTTRGGGRPENEFSSTIAWFQNPDAAVSAHLVIGHTPFDEVCRCVHDDDVAWHARTANATHLSIEICQAKPTDPITDYQYEAAARACYLWSRKYGFPIRRVMTITQPGLIGHEDSEPGKLDRKSDPGPMFDWNRFIKLAGGNVTPTPTPTTVDIAKERDALWAIAERLEKGGYAWTGQAVKAIVALSKQEK